MVKRILLCLPALLSVQAMLSSCLSDRLDSDRPARIIAPAGTFIGTELGKVFAFKGIPYAGPADGDRRWLPPTPAKSTGGEFTAHEYGKPCYQLSALSSEKDESDAFSGSADCLNLNVWVPKPKGTETEKTALPVMVFFYGGSFDSGSSALSLYGLKLYDGAKLAAAGDVIVVSFNYRLGAFGFFKQEQLNAGTGSNPGVLDQIEALRWIQNNIAAFGGDPKNVTAFGESAGAISICDLLTMPASELLIHKAILQSGSCSMLSPEAADRTASGVLKKLKCDKVDAIAQSACMRSASEKDIVLAQPALVFEGGEPLKLKFGPIVDGVTIKESPDSVIREKRHTKIPILIGTNAKELPASKQPDSKDVWESFIKTLADKGTEESARKLKLLYEEENRHGTYKNLIAELKTDMSFTCKARYFANLFSQNQTEPVWLYLFDKQVPFVGAWVEGSFHGMELFFLFQHLPKWTAGMAGVGFELQKTMAEIWTTFAKTGQLPENDWSSEWKPYTSERRIAGVIGDFTGVLDDPRKEKCELLEFFMLKDGDLGLTR